MKTLSFYGHLASILLLILVVYALTDRINRLEDRVQVLEVVAGMNTTRRRCRYSKCGHRWFTVELHEELAKWLDLADALKEMGVK